MAPDKKCHATRSLFKRGKLAVDFGQGLLEHVAVCGVNRGLQLTDQPLAREQQAFTPAIEFLLLRCKAGSAVVCLR